MKRSYILTSVVVALLALIWWIASAPRPDAIYYDSSSKQVEEYFSRYHDGTLSYVTVTKFGKTQVYTPRSVNNPIAWKLLEFRFQIIKLEKQLQIPNQAKQ